MINFVIIVSQKKIWNQIFYLITNQGLDILIRSLLMVRINKEVIDFLIYSVDNHKISYSSDYQDKFVLYYFYSNSINYKNVFFIDIGAFDGKTKSNTLLLESVGMNGICLEANPKLFDLILKNRSCAIEGSAIVTTYNKTNKYMLDLKGQRYLNSSLRKIDKNSKNSIATISVGEFLIKYQNILFNYSKIYLSIDIEGEDFRILENFLELGFQPDIISIEHNHNPEVRKNLLKLAQKYGYINKFRGFFRNEFVLIK
jgi:hypothetical protein